MKKNISVKFGFYFKDKNELISTAGNIKAFPPKQLKNIKPKIYSVLKGLESENILKAKDIILKIDKFKIKNVYDVFKARTKLKWNSIVNIEVKRNTQVLNYHLKIKSFVTKNPFIIDENTLVTDALSIINKKKITNLCVYKKDNKKKTIGVIHIHNLLNILK